MGRAVTLALIDYEQTNLNRIKVSADRGTIYLSGDVETREQTERAEQIARRVKGVRHVVNKLQAIVRLEYRFDRSTGTEG